MRRPKSIPSYTATLVVGLPLLALGVAPLADAAADPAPDAVTESRITDLIQQLGSPQYATRERAQQRLRAYGVLAFDALVAAQQHEDIEIATRARFILRGIPIVWSLDSDPVEVQGYLRDYDQQGRAERLSRLKMLAEVADAGGVPALCRVTRYEADAVLSKQAALQALSCEAPESSESRRALARRIEQAVGPSRQPAAEWLRTYARTLIDPAATIEDWDRLIRREWDALATALRSAPREVLSDLLRWHADFLLNLDRDTQARETILRIAELCEGGYPELFNLLDWAAEREAWFVAESLSQRFSAEFSQYSVLVYRLAEAQLRQGQNELAESTARRAFEYLPGVFNFHEQIARMLRQLRLYEWSEREFRYVIDPGEGQEADYGASLEARRNLADMLSDLERDGEAAKLLEEMLEQLKVEMPAILSGSDGRELQGRIDFHWAAHHGRQGDRERQRKHLTDAYRNNPENIDIVIAMFRVSDADPAWKDQTQKYLDESVQRLKRQMDALERQLRTAAGQENQDAITADLAQRNNEFAWLVSNTQGDRQAALRASLESLRLSPDNWAYLDTLGRCYFATGEFEQAVRQQRRAVKMAPYMQSMRRQLDLFERTWAEKKAG